VFEPTSWVFLGVLAAGFGGLLYWLVKAGHLALRIIAGVLAFGLSALCGAALVNDNYAYYTTWGSLFADLTGSGVVAYQPGFGPNCRPGRGVASRSPSPCRRRRP
jgi:hypothetical protein